jgi:hypothetical protein
MSIALSLLGKVLGKLLPHRGGVLEAAFSMRSVSYQRKSADSFFLELYFWFLGIVHFPGFFI